MVQDGDKPQPQVQTLEELLGASRAAPGFKEAVRAFATGSDQGPAKVPDSAKVQDRIEYNHASPPVKVLRFIMKLLEECPDRAIESVGLEAVSSCSTFNGQATIQTATSHPGELCVEFVWDCAWRARQMGWKDPFGDPDQIRAAEIYSYQCFRLFKIEQQAFKEDA